ncbi:ATP-binding protein, partial [Hydrogenophaga sp.]|uniref:ATP-binding protein n=1 Tax=Hydrogenophaga sp. TaxID=1904254 RepID=UPI002FC75C98
EWSVRDQGPGIPDYARERIFERFYSLPRGEAQDKGSGLGLCLVKEVSDLHGGQVWVDNVVQPSGCLARWRLPA